MLMGPINQAATRLMSLINQAATMLMGSDKSDRYFPRKVLKEEIL